jgi:predicted anti-sigma-YlaC factor YlaD
MTRHPTPDELSRAAAGLDLEPAVRSHLVDCVACRAETRRLEPLLDARRREMWTDEPDWDEQHRQIMSRLPSTAATAAARQGRWRRPLLAAAALVAMGVGLAVLVPDRRLEPPGADVAVEEILGEMDDLLADDSIPGFEIIDPEGAQLEAYFDNGAS